MGRTQLAVTPRSAREARRLVALALSRRQLPAEMTDVAELLTSELVTNAMQHATTAAVSLAVDVEGGSVRVEVGDDDPTPLKRSAGGAEAASGRGLGMVEVLATAWGVTAPVDEVGKRVWFILAPP
jgi:anti-sigma regulatory factor (Ser/Thr protein kinase)